jgi:hypothetical protein
MKKLNATNHIRQRAEGADTEITELNVRSAKYET